MEQRLSSPKQHKWLTKMSRYEYEIIYKKEKDKVVVDAISYQYEDEGSLFSLLVHIPEWLEVTHQERFNDPPTT